MLSLLLGLPDGNIHHVQEPHRQERLSLRLGDHEHDAEQVSTEGKAPELSRAGGFGFAPEQRGCLETAATRLQPACPGSASLSDAQNDFKIGSGGVFLVAWFRALGVHQTLRVASV